jgi:hypothetical protein
LQRTPLSSAMVADRSSSQGPCHSPGGAWSSEGSPVSTSPRCGVLKPFRYTTPGGPAPCPRHDHEALGDYAASALPSAPGHGRVLPRGGHAVGECPSARPPDLPATRRGLLSAGGTRGPRLATCGRDQPGTLPLWVWGVSATVTPPASRRFRQRCLASA